MGVIYCLTSPSGKQYIGQTKRAVDQRLKEHATRPASCSILYNAIIKYGIESFDTEILVETNNDMLNHYETLFINMYNTIEPGSTLPIYMVYVKPRPAQYQHEGYAIINHPQLKTKYFTTKTKSLEEKYNIAFEYLNS